MKEFETRLWYQENQFVSYFQLLWMERIEVINLTFFSNNENTIDIFRIEGYFTQQIVRLENYNRMTANF